MNMQRVILIISILAGLGGWLLTGSTNTWGELFTPQAFGGLIVTEAGIIAAAFNTSLVKPPRTPK